jgi:hypothetical protein
VRKLIVTNIVSLDGYYEAPGGNVMVLPIDHSFDAYNADGYGRPTPCCSGATPTSCSRAAGPKRPTIRTPPRPSGRSRADDAIDNSSSRTASPRTGRQSRERQTVTGEKEARA